MTKSDLIAKRDATYREPPEKRCSTCRFVSYFHTHCQAIEIRGKFAPKEISPLGVCDLWEPKQGAK